MDDLFTLEKELIGVQTNLKKSPSRTYSEDYVHKCLAKVDTLWASIKDHARTDFLLDQMVTNKVLEECEKIVEDIRLRFKDHSESNKNSNMASFADVERFKNMTVRINGSSRGLHNSKMSRSRVHLSKYKNIYFPVDCCSARRDWLLSRRQTLAILPKSKRFSSRHINETSTEFAFRLQGIANRGGVDESSLIEYIVSGLGGSPTEKN